MSEQSRIDWANEQRIIQNNETNEELRQINQQNKDLRRAYEIRRSIFIPKFNLLAEDFYQRAVELNIPANTQINQVKKDWWNGEHDVFWKYAYLIDNRFEGNGWDEPQINYWTVMLKEDGNVFCGSDHNSRCKFFWASGAILKEDLHEGPGSQSSLETDEEIDRELDRFANNMATILYPNL